MEKTKKQNKQKQAGLPFLLLQMLEDILQCFEGKGSDSRITYGQPSVFYV